jgi:hypothetical protein
MAPRALYLVMTPELLLASHKLCDEMASALPALDGS